MSKRRFYDGGEVHKAPPNIDPDAASEAAKSMRKAFNFAKGGDVECKACKGGVCYAHGGEVDLADHVYKKRMSRGGMVANETEPMVDSKEAEYDDLVLRDDLESSYTGANSGDHLGNKRLEHDEHDIVSKVMRSRRLKDKMPRPA